MKKPAEAKVKKVSFRAEIERLEEIVRALEGNDVDLDRALKLFEDGVRSLSRARELLQQSELTVRRVLEEADGSVSTDHLDL
jgi:exodeoxyribonuclease VII small subunit